MSKLYNLQLGDTLDLMKSMPDNSVDLVLCSPPYEAARKYGELNFKLKGQAWVDWAVERYIECCRVSRGLVAWVVAGQTRNYRWSATPALLMADLHRAGIKLRNPPIYVRHGIPGSGGPDWWASKYETIVCASNGKLPWSDNTATGHEPKFKPGGNPSHQTRSGRVKSKPYKPPSKANPGNLIICGAAGGGNIGGELAHDNEAPFPEKLAEAFVLSFCPPGGTVFDPFSGSGTTGAVAVRHGRFYLGHDLRQSQIDLSRQRIEESLTMEAIDNLASDTIKALTRKRTK